MGASEGRLAARSPISNSILFTLPVQLHQMQPSLKSRYDRHSRGWNFFVSTPRLPFFFSHFTLPLAMHPLPPSPSDAAGWTTTLDRRERADKSLHGDSAFCKSCCGRRVFSFPLSLFLPPLLPTSYTTPPFLSPPLLCTFSASYPHFLLQFEKSPFPWSTWIPFASLFYTCSRSQSPFISLLISQDRQERGGRQDGEDIMFT